MELVVIRNDFNENIIDVTIMVTRLCNYNCEYCIEHIPYDNINNNFIDLNKILIFINNIIDNFKYKTINIRIYGGEPTLHPNLYTFCLELNKNKFINIIEIFTNFSLKKELYLKYLEIEKVNLFTSFHTNAIMSSDQYLYKILSCNKFYNKITCNIMYENNNIDKMLTLYKQFQICWKNNLYKKSKTELIPIFSTIYKKSIYKKQNIQALNSINSLFNEKLQFTIKTDNLEYKDYKVVGVDSLNLNGWKCSSGVNSIFIDPNGDVYPCGGLYTKRNIYYKNNVIKNIFKDSIFNIFQPTICQSTDCVLCVPLKAENINKLNKSIYNIKEKYKIYG